MAGRDGALRCPDEPIVRARTLRPKTRLPMETHAGWSSLPVAARFKP
jgi:hypothetical protein